MTWTSDFAVKNFTEQISILSRISKEKDMQALPDLFSLYQQPLGDKPVDAMVEHTLRDLLHDNETETVAKISSGSVKEKKLCLLVARLEKFPSAIPVLEELVKTELDSEILQAAFLTMAEFADRRFLDIFRSHLVVEDEIIAAICIEMVGILKDIESLPQLQFLICNCEQVSHYHDCNIDTIKAITAVGTIGNDDALFFLVSKLHHKNPTARRVIHEVLAEHGEVVVPKLAEIFKGESVDQAILAANVLGRIGSRNAGIVLVHALESETAHHSNVRFAIYEALGFIPSATGLIALIDGLAETEELTLRAVLSSLEMQFNPLVGKQIATFINDNSEQGVYVLKTIIPVMAVNLFSYLYELEQTIAEKLITVLQNSKDNEILVAFAEKIKASKAPWAAEDINKVHWQQNLTPKGPRILAVDDSASMLSYYRSVCTDMMLEISTATNGKEAWELLTNCHSHYFNLILVDMNMPVMDGIEFTKKIRASQPWSNIPIIMATTESDHSQSQIAKQSGVNEFIVKPMTFQVLESTIKKLLN